MKEFAVRFDKLEPRRKRVAIVGFASSTRLNAPYADQSWEIWGMNQLYRFIPRLTRWWELHPHEGPYSYLADEVPGTNYMAWLTNCPAPLYMVSQHPAIPSSIEYPFQQIVDEFGLEDIRPDSKGKGYFHSTVDYMIALAIHEGFEEIGIWGVDMVHDSEYGYQKPSGSFWLGVARGRGVKLTVPLASALLANEGYRYGYDPMPTNELVLHLEHRRKQLMEQQSNLTNQLISIQGALVENAHWMDVGKQLARGGHLASDTKAV